MSNSDKIQLDQSDQSDQLYYFQIYKKQILNETKLIYQSYCRDLKIDSSNAENTYPREGPLTSDQDCKVIDTLLEKEDYLVLTTGNTVYTLGLWLLYGLPELVIDVSNRISTIDDGDIDNLYNLNVQDTNADQTVHVIINTYINSLLDTVHKRLHSSDNKITMKRFYDQENRNLLINNIKLKLLRVPEEEYINLNVDQMIWFYTYYMMADNDRNVILSENDSKVIEENDGLEYQLYPIYRTTLEYNDLLKTSTMNNYTETINKLLNQTYSDFSDDSLDNVESVDTEDS